MAQATGRGGLLWIILSVLLGRFEGYDTPQLAVKSTEVGLNVSTAANAFSLSSIFTPGSRPSA